jgi:propanol-preferring alcohol dehydrogenase
MHGLLGLMRAMRLFAAHRPLESVNLPIPEPASGQVLLRVRACGVCRTDVHLADGELSMSRLPVTPGHEIVGEVVALGAQVRGLAPGERVGVPWLASSCGHCFYCARGEENLCGLAEFTGCMVDGGYAEYAVADAASCLAIPERYADAQAAPLLCAGLIGYRAYRAAGEAPRLGLYGFGAAAHILAQIAVAQHRRVFAFTRPGDTAVQSFARHLGAEWAGDSDDRPPEELDAAIIFAPVGELVPAALAATRRGGRVVCAGIHMTDIPGFPYGLLRGERSICSVANLTRADGREFMQIAACIDLRPAVEILGLGSANEALERVRQGAIAGALVLCP